MSLIVTSRCGTATAVLSFGVKHPVAVPSVICPKSPFKGLTGSYSLKGAAHTGQKKRLLIRTYDLFSYEVKKKHLLLQDLFSLKPII